MLLVIKVLTKYMLYMLAVYLNTYYPVVLHVKVYRWCLINVPSTGRNFELKYPIIFEYKVI